jgi:hypothetical protein
MEVARGPSDKWEYTEASAEREKILDSVFVEWESKEAYIPAVLSMHIKRKWIEWAWQIGDPTVWEYAEKSSFPQTVTYHDSIHSPKDFPIPDMTSKRHKRFYSPDKGIVPISLSREEMTDEPTGQQSRSSDKIAVI